MKRVSLHLCKFKLPRIPGLMHTVLTMNTTRIGVGIGLVLTSVLFALISSSVNAVLVCYAESPLEFEHNHPELSGEMRASWLEVWPGYMEAGDFRGPVVTGVSVPII